MFLLPPPTPHPNNKKGEGGGLKKHQKAEEHVFKKICVSEKLKENYHVTSEVGCFYCLFKMAVVSWVCILFIQNDSCKLGVCTLYSK